MTVSVASSSDLPCVVGIVSAYVPNLATRTTLPGLSLARHVGQLQNLVKALQSLDEAQSDQTRPESGEDRQTEVDNGDDNSFSEPKPTRYAALAY